MHRDHATYERASRRGAPPQPASWLYRQMARLAPLSYLQKLILVLLACTHLPLALLLLAATAGMFDAFALETGHLLLGLAGTLLSAGLAGVVVEQMLRPVTLTAQALEAYALEGRTIQLPTHYDDAAGHMMRDASGLLAELDDLRRGPENYDAASELPNRAFLSRFIAELAHAGVGFRVRMVRIMGLEGSVRPGVASALLHTLAETLEQDDAARTIARIDDRTLALVELTREGEATPASLQRPIDAFVRDAEDVAPQVHAGEALFPRHGSDAEGLLAAAAATLVPVSGAVAAPALSGTDAHHDTADLDRDLRRAVTDGDFRLFLQPVVATRTERIVSAEALLRWNRPLIGNVPPSRFIPLLEKAGMIDEVGRWVLTAACRAIKVCDAAGLPQLQIAVNVSARELRNPGLLRQIRDVLAFEGVAPNRIELEMTESSAAEDLTRSRALFVGLRDLGVGVAIDDFGTGQGGLAYLKALPFSKLKIDREFVAGVDRRRDCQAICQSAIALAGGFDIDVVAEGVETAAEAARLRTFGCTQLQGFRFGRPMPAVDFPAFALHGT